MIITAFVVVRALRATTKNIKDKIHTKNIKKMTY